VVAIERDVSLSSLLDAVEDASPVDVVDAFARTLATSVDAAHASLLISNFSGSGLVRLSHVTGAGSEQDGRNERAGAVPLPGTIYEEVLFSQEPQVLDHEGGWLVLVPVTERGDAIGLLELSFARKPGADVLDHLITASHALAYALIASRRHTDLFEWAQRDVPFSVAAEIQRRLLPAAYTVEAGPVTLAGWLEPSHNAGGDTFDYSLDREYLYLSVTDAMGHSLEAAQLATLAVGTLRNRRRALESPAAQADAADRELQGQARADQFVTGLVMRIRIADGLTEVVNAGHPAPFLIRDGQVWPLDIRVQPPLGVAVAPYQAGTMTLKPGDRLLVVTDGYLERKAARVDIESILRATLGRHPRQIVQELARSIIDVTGGDLHDDATCVCLDWYGPAGARASAGGAAHARVTR
jgi:serine phosphatase RsbU (regulator of sigma subunit)